MKLQVFKRRRKLPASGPSNIPTLRPGIIKTRLITIIMGTVDLLGSDRCRNITCEKKICYYENVFRIITRNYS